MTHLILRSQVSDGAAFDAAVDAHARELEAYAKHAALVANGNADPYPPPVAHPLVDAAVKRVPRILGGTKFESDYRIVDRLPVQAGDETALTARKNELREEVTRLEREAVHAILPLGKWRLMSLRANMAAAKTEKNRTAADGELLEEERVRRESLAAVQIHHAELEAAIEDLTAETINDWTPAPYAAAKKGRKK